MRDLPGRYKDQAATFGFLALLVAFVATVLLPGYRLANELSASTAALKLVSEQRSHPDAMMRSLVAVRDQLGTGSYVGQTIRDLDAQLREYDAALAGLQQTTAGDAPELVKTAAIWSQYRRILEPVAGHSGIPYVDSDAVRHPDECRRPQAPGRHPPGPGVRPREHARAGGSDDRHRRGPRARGRHGRRDPAPPHDRRHGLRRAAHRAARLLPVAQDA